MRKYFKVAAFSAFFCGSLFLAQTASKSLEPLDSNLNKIRFKTENVANPNILFIISDDHGWGDLPSNWDKTEVQMPRLDALANSGTRFTNYHTVPLCAPSRACLFTGQFTSENGMWRGPGAFLVSPDTRESSATLKCSRSICPMPATPLVVLANGIWEHNRENSPMIVALMSFAGSLVDRVPIG